MDVTPSCKNSSSLQVRTGARHFAAPRVARTWRERHRRDCRETTTAVIHRATWCCKGTGSRAEMTNDENQMSKEIRNPNDETRRGRSPDRAAPSDRRESRSAHLAERDDDGAPFPRLPDRLESGVAFSFGLGVSY